MSPEFLALFMFVGLLAGLFMGYPLAFVLGGVAVLAAYFGPGTFVFGLIISRLYGGVMDNYVLVAIPLFILMARFLSDSGVTDRMFETMRLLLGPLRGGLGLAVVVVSVLLAATTGIIGASITVIGVIALRPMLTYGYDKRISCGLIASAGSLGILIPPSIMLILMASYSPVSVGQLFAGALVPGLLLGLMYAGYVLAVAHFRPDLAPAATLEERALYTNGQLFRMLLVEGAPPMVLIIGVLGSLLFGIATATEASAIGAALAFLIMVARGRFSWRTLQTAVAETGKTTTMVLLVVVGATAFTGVFTAGGGLATVQGLMRDVGLAPWAMVVLMLAIVFVLGTFLDWTGIVLLSFPIFLPIVQEIGMEPLWFIVAMAVVLQTSFLTPPFGYALFYLKGVAPEGVSTGDIIAGVLPFLVLIILAVILMAVFPGLVLWLPQALLG
jgi:tripartite ATP-independent transporter DctM subunit